MTHLITTYRCGMVSSRGRVIHLLVGRSDNIALCGRTVEKPLPIDYEASIAFRDFTTKVCKTCVNLLGLFI